MDLLCIPVAPRINSRARVSPGTRVIPVSSTGRVTTS
uniref:Uncharacterized protein n=1 Tax=Anguilla anguilla TaxID=7936 RepID=A0A0E9UEY3_ANGAN